MWLIECTGKPRSERRHSERRRRLPRGNTARRPTCASLLLLQLWPATLQHNGPPCCCCCCCRCGPSCSQGQTADQSSSPTSLRQVHVASCEPRPLDLAGRMSWLFTYLRTFCGAWWRRRGDGGGPTAWAGRCGIKRAWVGLSEGVTHSRREPGAALAAPLALMEAS